MVQGLPQMKQKTQRRHKLIVQQYLQTLQRLKFRQIQLQQNKKWGFGPIFLILNFKHMGEKSKEKILFVLNLALLGLLWFTINIYKSKLSVVEKRIHILEERFDAFDKNVINK